MPTSLRRSSARRWAGFFDATLWFVGLFVIAGAPVRAQPRTTEAAGRVGSAAEDRLPRFDIADSDGDGRLQPIEWAPIANEPFADYDADNSGDIDRAEFEVYLERQRQTIESLPAPSDLPPELMPIEDEAQFEFSRGNYERAAKMFALLAEKVPALPEFKFRLGECYFRMNRIDQARAVYESVRKSEPDNIVALVAMARIDAKAAGVEADLKRKKAFLENARANLLAAARLGANALKAVQVHPELAVFKDDVGLLISLAKAWQQFEIPTAVRDPFINPIPRKDSVSSTLPGGEEQVSPADRWDIERQRQVVAELKALVADLRDAIAAEDFQRVAELWSSIEEILRHEKSITDAESAVVIRRLKEEVKANESVVQSLLLSAYYATGERILADMREALDAQEFERLFELADRLEEHLEHMRKTDNEIFVEKAAELEARGKELVEKGRTLEEIGRFRIEVTATVVGGGVAQAIVNNRVLGEGDLVYDLRGNPISDLKVLEIERRRVWFSYKGLRFARELRRGA